MNLQMLSAIIAVDADWGALILFCVPFQAIFRALKTMLHASADLHSHCSAMWNVRTPSPADVRFRAAQNGSTVSLGSTRDPNRTIRPATFRGDSPVKQQLERQLAIGVALLALGFGGSCLGNIYAADVGAHNLRKYAKAR
jgi:hypothetical protein